MQAREFVYWLQGFFEISKESQNYSGELNSAQVKMIEKHLSLVFTHEIDPSYGNQSHLNALNNIHDHMFKTSSEEAADFCDAQYAKIPRPRC